jgi:GR25 family glycosyltransferase involved in LPS biosynthesis
MIILTIIIIIILIIIYLFSLNSIIKQLNFVIIINSSNILTYESIFRQTFVNYRLLIVDGKENNRMIEYWSMGLKTKYINSISDAEINNDEIKIILDDNYRFIDDNVLMYLNHLFNTNNIDSINNNIILYKGKKQKIHNIIGYNSGEKTINISFPIFELSDKYDLPKLKSGQELNKSEILLINLKRRSDRLDFMKYKLRNFEYSISIWYSVDGYSSKNINFADSLKDSRIKSPGALGLLLTYLELIDYCLEKNLDRVILIEDDIYISDEFLKYDFNSLKEDVVYLGANQDGFSKIQEEELKQGFYHVDKEHYTYGTYGISLSKSFLIKLKSEITKYQYPIDVVIYKLLIDCNTCTNLVLYPNLVIPELRESDNMGKRDLVEFSLSKKWDLNKYHDIEKYNIFISDFNILKILKLTKNTRFVFIIPSYNNEKWIEKNISSVIKQLYPLWRIIYIDDNSTDFTNSLINEIVKREKIEDKFTLIKNNERMYQGYSRYIAYNKVDDDEVILFLDGDDWLYDDKVLHYLNSIYKKGYECTYGRFCIYNKGQYSGILGFKEFPREVVQKKEYRKYKWISQHLRTCRGKLIKSIPEYHLKDWDNNWLKCCTDLAEMFWILEQSNGKHINSGRLLYVYNKENSKNYEYSAYRDEQKEYRIKVENYVRSRS